LVEYADIIAVGRILRLVANDEPLADRSLSIDDIDPIMAIDRYFKGSGPPEIMVDDPAQPTACAIFDERSKDRVYIVFLSQDEGNYRTSVCAGTASFDDGSPAPDRLREVVVLFGPGIAPLSASDFPSLPAAALAVLGPLAFVAGAAFLWPRRGGPRGG
jgi:hypothetical protein